jgi:hypothetical protein
VLRDELVALLRGRTGVMSSEREEREEVGDEL